LSVNEHLYFYGRIKGISNLKMEIEKILNDVELTEFKNTKIKHLSGGMKRRLSIAIALLGDPKIILFDEPTTGLDVNSKRNLWDVILRARKGKCIILTTHSLEEADVLCT